MIQDLARFVFALGSSVGGLLAGLLVLSIAAPRYRIWPTPGDGSAQGYLFWPLFRTLNVLCIAAALLDRTAFLGLPGWVRILALLLLLLSLALFLYAFRVLGRDNSYCATNGLVTSGIYQWTRNPQNAMLIAVYCCLAVAADSLSATVLCTLMVAAYTLMVLAEEPWLETSYGEAYRNYCAAIPRFFHWRRAFREARTAVTRLNDPR